MMRAKLKEAVGHEPTAADYDEALRLVEEITEGAAKEPTSEKVQNEIMRRLYNVSGSISGALISMLSLGSRPNEKDQAWDVERMEIWNDAALELKKLKEKAQEFETK
jgi:hypothetical protein